MEKKHLLKKLRNGLFATALTLSFPNLVAQPIITQTFSFTGAVQVATLCADQVTIECWGSEGGGAPTSGNVNSGPGGKGGYSRGVLNITPTTTLNIYVGGIGASADNGLAAGGWNGGGAGYASSNGEPGNGGGGASDVRVNGTALANRVIVAGGGGGGGEDGGDNVGHGGGLTGAGSAYGYDATQTVAGPGGALGLGGSTGQGDGGGGGGGYYGGGTIPNSSLYSDCQGGGGGSGYIGGVLNGVTIAGNASMPSPSGGTTIGRSGAGVVKISYVNSAGTTVSASQSVICNGQSAILTASGPGSYTWSTGATTSTISVSPAVSATYNVVGMNPNTGCVGNASKAITVIESPAISIMSFQNSICEGQSVTMQAVGANSYTWSAGPAFTPVLTVTPSIANNSYTVVGMNVFGCTSQAVYQVVVNPLPTVVVPSSTIICFGSSANLTASGANTYEWASNSQYLQTNPVSVSPGVTTTYSVIGTSTAGCKGSSMVTVAVDICSGIKNISGEASHVSVYPNPNTGIFTVALVNGLSKTIEVTDITGRVIISNTTTNDSTDLNISELSNGVYYVKVKSENTSEVIKVVKQ